MKSNSAFLAPKGSIYNIEYVVGTVNYIFETTIYLYENQETEDHTFYICASCLQEAKDLIKEFETNSKSIEKIEITLTKTVI